MHLEGSCHCGSVRFSVDADSPVPFMRCYCSICRKTAGAGGFAINLGARTHSMRVRGKRHLRIFRARVTKDSGKGTQASSARRYFCARCGSALWLWDPTWPELVHPHASAIDTPLPVPPQRRRQAKIAIELDGRPLGDVTADLEALMKNEIAPKMPPNFEWGFARDVEMMQDTASAMGLALGLAVAFIYIVGLAVRVVHRAAADHAVAAAGGGRRCWRCSSPATTSACRP